MKKQKLTLLSDLHVCRLNNGVILRNLNDSLQYDHALIDTGNSVADLMQLPLSFWLLNKKSETKIINSEGIIACGFHSEDEAIGHSLIKVSERDSALKLIKNCDEVIQSNTLKIFEECLIRKDGIQQHFLSIKLPWYDYSQKLIGIFGFSIVLGRHSLAGNLSILTRLGFLNNQINTIQMQEGNTFQYLNLPLREKQCLNYIKQGYTAKMIARELNLSFRTIESYINNLKNRLGVNTRFELLKI